MKRFLLSLMAFAAFASVIYIILVFLHGMLLPKKLGGNVLKYDPAYTYTASRLAEADTIDDIDLLILGSSHAYRGYDTRNFEKRGFKTMNLGTSAQTLMQTKYVLNKYVDKLKPQYVILDIYPILFSTNGAESTIELVSVSGFDKDLYELVAKTVDIRAYNTLILSSVESALHLKHKLTKDRPSKDRTYYPGGFVGYTYAEYNAAFDPKETPAAPINISKESEEYLNKIVAILKKRNIKYFIFQAPLPQCRYNTITNNSEIDATLKKFGPYYNFNATNALPNNYFIDDSHLNSKGVALYNSYVLKKLAEAGVTHQTPAVQ